jgi:hypothetical protein
VHVRVRACVCARVRMLVQVENSELNPIRWFKDAPFDADLMGCCAGFEKPTAIQVGA